MQYILEDNWENILHTYNVSVRDSTTSFMKQNYNLLVSIMTYYINCTKNFIILKHKINIQ